jgi:hypothetical protein
VAEDIGLYLFLACLTPASISPAMFPVSNMLYGVMCFQYE